MSEKLSTKELREGNKIKANDVYQGKIMTFDRFNEDKTVCFFSDGHKWGIGEYLKDCEPVVLTSEILLACGFKKINHIDGYVFYTASDSKINKCHISIFEKRSSFYGYPVKHLEFLHQLQNLYFALTNQELEFKTELK